MTNLSGDELFEIKKVTPENAKYVGKTLRAMTLEFPNYCQWMESLPDATKIPGTCNFLLSQYLWANPPAWRRDTAMSLGTKPVLLMLLDTETTTFFSTNVGGNGLPMGGPRELAANGELARVFHLLEVAWKVVDPLTFTTVESWESLCKPEGAFEQVYNQSLYENARLNGRTLSECMHFFMYTLRRLKMTHDVYIVCHNVAFDRKVLAYSLASLGMYEAYTELLGTPWLCTMVSVYGMESARQEYNAWARQAYPESYEKGGMRPPRLERLHYYCTGRDVVQEHRAMSDVDMMLECLPNLVQRGWFKLPTQTVPSPHPNGLMRALKKALKTTTTTSGRTTATSGRTTARCSAASKHTSSGSHTYFLRSTVVN